MESEGIIARVFENEVLGGLKIPIFVRQITSISVFRLSYGLL